MKRYYYIVVQYAEQWNEDGYGEVYHTYEECKKRVKDDKFLLAKLEWCERHKDEFSVYGENEVDLIISYF